MAPGRRPAAVTGWALGAVGIGALAVAAVLLAARTDDTSFPSAELTQSPTWTIVMAPSLALALGFTVWTGYRGEVRLARWMLAACASAALYWFAPAAGGALVEAGATGAWVFALLLVIGVSGWTTVLALLQLTALTAAEAAVGESVARGARTVLVVGAVCALASPLLLPFTDQLTEYPRVPTVLPRELLGIPALQITGTVVVYLWMFSLFVAPIVLWVAAVRARGARRRALARVAIGAMLPALVVALCGVLASMERTGSGFEVDGLALGFSIALPATLGWLAATVRDAKSASARVTSIGGIVRALLWTLYVLSIMQIAAPLATAFGSSPASGALVSIVVLAATFLPWRMLVAWCVRKVDPRAAIAAAIAADRTGAPAVVAQDALRDALGDQDARLLIPIRSEGAVDWLDADGYPTEPPPSSTGGIDDEAAIDVVGSRERTVAVLVSRGRFIDARPLVAAIRPLAERASLEAEVRATAARAAAERRRADLAAVQARHRIERDLHDGVQGRLVSLGLGLSLAREDVPDPVSRGLLDETIVNLQAAVAELRELASGELSGRLAEDGLAAAVGDLVSRMPMRVDVDIRPPVLGAGAESTAYFVIAESLANVVKHARARRVSVIVSGEEDVVVAVSDDGEGGADLRTGTGLRGLQERVHSAGGRLIVSDNTPRGTLVEAILPCGL
ncbi:MAG: histidine kinase [Microbacterium sp.]